MMSENIVPTDIEIVTKFNQLTNNVSKLGGICASTSAQLFVILRRLKYIEAYLQRRDQKYMPFDEEKDEASVFVNKVCNDEIDLDDLDPEKRTVQ